MEVSGQLHGRKTDRGENCVMMNFITCSSPNIVRVIKSRRMRWTGHVAWGRGEVFTGFSWEARR
jgi:hypothetical protein